MSNISEVDNLIDQVKDINKEMADIAVKMKKKQESIFNEAVRKIFDMFPEVNRFTWCQYTPHFNDGDECVFSVSSDSLTLNSDTPYGYDIEEYGEPGSDIGYYNIWGSLRDSKPLSRFEQAYKAIHTLIESIDESTLRSIFGDHAAITVHRNKVVVEYYHHD